MTKVKEVRGAAQRYKQETKWRILEKAKLQEVNNIMRWKKWRQVSEVEAVKEMDKLKEAHDMKEVKEVNDTKTA